MAQLSRPQEPFGEVNVYRAGNGGLDVVVTILVEPDVEGARAALALDGSSSMRKFYGISNVKSALLAKAAAPPNIMESIARDMAKYLAGFAADSSVDVVYWSCGAEGDEIEASGNLTAANCGQTGFAGPRQKDWGRQTQLRPVVQHFVESAFRDAKWGIGVVVTDGEVDDLEAVKTYSMELGRRIADGTQHDLKLVLVGVCTEGASEEARQLQIRRMHEQMEQLDDLFEGSGLKKPDGDDVDIWDHKVANEMEQLVEIFAEVVSENVQVLESGRILDGQGKVVRDYGQFLPSLLRFSLPAGSTRFTLDCPAGQFHQDISEVLDRL